MTNQDHNTPAGADERVPADRTGAAAGEAAVQTAAGSAAAPSDTGERGPGSAEYPQPGAVYPPPSRQMPGGSGDPPAHAPASRPGWGEPSDGGPYGPQSAGPWQYAAQGGYNGPGGYVSQSGYEAQADYESGGVPAPQAPSYRPADYEYGQSYADPGQESGWNYAEQGLYPAPQYVPRYPDSSRQPEPEFQPGPGAYPGTPADGVAYPSPPSDQGDSPGYGIRADYGSMDAYGITAGYGNMSAPQSYAVPPAPAEALAPLPPRRTDQPARETSESLTSESLLPTRKPAPAPGWRRAIYRATGGLIRPGDSQAELRRRELIVRARTPVAGGHHRVAVMSLKGGVGKTTTTVGLGATLASLRGDRVIAVDANPDRGTLSDKVRLETVATVRDLLNESPQIQRYADVRAFTSQAPSRLELLASDRDPTVSVAFSEDDYYDVAHVLEHYYSICLTDCGTGLLHSAMSGVLRLADQIVLVSSPSVDGARSASATLDWLDAHDCGDLVRNAVVVLSIIRPRSKSTVDIDRLQQHFAGRCRAVARIPYDAHLEEGAEVDLEKLNLETADAYLLLAATVGDGFAWPRRVRATAS